MSFARQNHVTKYDTQTATPAARTLSDCSTFTSGTSNQDRRWRIRRLLASYGTSTQGGTVTITCAGVTVMVFDFVGNVGDALDFGDSGWQMPTPGDVVITLSAGAAAVVGHLTTIAFPE